VKRGKTSMKRSLAAKGRKRGARRKK
jgi:hypothetical protein